KGSLRIFKPNLVILYGEGDAMAASLAIELGGIAKDAGISCEVTRCSSLFSSLPDGLSLVASEGLFANLSDSSMIADGLIKAGLQFTYRKKSEYRCDGLDVSGDTLIIGSAP